MAISPLSEHIFQIPGQQMVRTLPKDMKTWIADSAILFAEMSGHIEPEQDSDTSDDNNYKNFDKDSDYMRGYPKMTKCANEGETCECKSKIFYGHELNGELNHRIAFAKKSADPSNSTSCSNSVFTDPLYGIGKACFCVYTSD
jgi:hypothetical protein